MPRALVLAALFAVLALLAVKQSSADVFAFDWTVTGAQARGYVNEEHFCLRAEVSVDRDWRPPFFTPVYRSNNRAQRNVAIVRAPVTSPSGVIFKLEGPSAHLLVDSHIAAGRSAYLFIPSTAVDVWKADEDRSFPPDEGRIITLEPGRNSLNVDLPTDGVNVAQILIDGNGEPPGESESILIEQEGAGGFEIRFQAPVPVPEGSPLIPLFLFVVALVLLVLLIWRLLVYSSRSKNRVSP